MLTLSESFFRFLNDGRTLEVDGKELGQIVHATSFNRQDREQCDETTASQIQYLQASVQRGRHICRTLRKLRNWIWTVTNGYKVSQDTVRQFLTRISALDGRKETTEALQSWLNIVNRFSLFKGEDTSQDSAATHQCLICKAVLSLVTNTVLAHMHEMIMRKMTQPLRLLLIQRDGTFVLGAAAGTMDVQEGDVVAVLSTLGPVAVLRRALVDRTDRRYWFLGVAYVDGFTEASEKVDEKVEEKKLEDEKGLRVFYIV